MSNHRGDFHLFVLERDVYARQAIVSYLSWDRRTRVIGKAGSFSEMKAVLEADPVRLDGIILDTALAPNAPALSMLITSIRSHVPEADVICLGHGPDRDLVRAAKDAGAVAYLDRDEVDLGIASAVWLAFHLPEFIVTHGVAALLDSDHKVLPERRSYPRLTQRVEQALLLCVIEGLPAELAAEEMGVSTSTVRSYIKEGYRVMEAADATVYPPTMSPAERAFLRYSSLEDGHFNFIPAA